MWILLLYTEIVLVYTEMVCVHKYKQTCDYVCVLGGREKGLILIEILEVVTVVDIKQATDCTFEVSYQ